MTGANREIELKFACGPDDLAAVMAAAPAGDDETRELISVYFDTPDLALQKAGASLRVREHRGKRVQTLKRGEGLVREEHEAPIEGLSPDPALEPLPSLLPEGASLRPAFNVRVSRRQRTVRYRDAEIEMALDQGEVTGGDRRSPICELELELKSGPPAALFALARELSAAAPLYLAFDSKAARGQALLSGAPATARRSERIELSGKATVAEAFQIVARGALAQIAANAACLRSEPAPDAVHQLRVGARRLRSALTSFKAVVAGEALEAVKADLRWLSQACDRARNLDVFADETLRPAEIGEGAPPGLRALHEAVEAARRAAWASAGQAVASDRFRALMIDTAAWVETGAWLSHAAGEAQIRPFARNALNRRLKILDKRCRDARDGDDTARHHLRIAAKTLRYACEGFESLYGRKAVERYLHTLKDLQEMLGALNDRAVAEPLVAGLPLCAEAAFAAGELVGRQQAEKPALVARAGKAADKLLTTRPFWD
ncbi:MAG: CHAD domain-containing protein [Caulobacterales bacterium]